MRPATLARLAVAGNRTDLLRTVLTAVSAALAVVALLAAATVGAITGYAERYSNALLVEPGLRPGVLTALVLTAVPVLALAGQCIRLGAPARDRRLAAIRLAGATPGEAVLIATAETAVSGALGSVLGLGAYHAVRAILAGRHTPGPRDLPTDVLPAVWPTVLILLVVPVLAALIGGVLMRRVIVTPLGVVRRVRHRGPRPWPGLLIGVGLVLFGVVFRMPPDRVLPDAVLTLLLGSGVVLTTAGVVLGTGWISYTAGRLLRRYGRGPATLLAGQRLITDPWNGSRTLAALLAALVGGAVALGFREMLATEFRLYEVYNAMLRYAPGEGVGAGAEPEFYFGAIRLIMVVVALGAAVAAAGMLVALAESIVARRRTYAALTAGGVPRRTLSAAVLWQTLAPLVPAVLLALGAGISLIRLAGTEQRTGGFTVEECVSTDGAACVPTQIKHPLVELAVPVPLQDLALLGGGALLAVLLAAGAGLLVLRSSTDLEELRVG
jgi:hypothetical protein